MKQTKRDQVEKHPAARLNGDAETFCAILARIIARIAEQEQPHQSKA